MPSAAEPINSFLPAKYRYTELDDIPVSAMISSIVVA